MPDTGPGTPDTPISFTPIWDHTRGLLGRHGDLLWPLAAAFMFLPQLLIAVLTPEPQPGAAPDFAALVPLLLVAVAGFVATVVGQVAMSFIAVNDGTAGMTVKEVIAHAFARLPSAMAAILMQGIALLVGLLLLIVPGIWAAARLSVVTPLIATGPDDPVGAVRESWRLTEGRALRIIGCMLILALGMFLLYFGIIALAVGFGAISTMAAGAPTGDSWGIGRWLFEIALAATVAGFGLVSVCFYASMLRALRAATPHDPAQDLQA